MPSYTRHQLKEDKFASFVSKEMQLASANRKTILIALAALAAILIVGVGIFSYINERDDKASIALGDAFRTYNSQLRPAGTPPVAGITTFTSIKERAEASEKQFLQIASNFSSTRNGKFARYMAGIAANEAGDAKTAEQNLSEASNFRDKDLSSLAKFALASIYRHSQRDSDAIRLYQELIDVNSTTVPKSTAEFELASLYEAKQQPAEAAKIYEQIQKDEQANRPAVAAAKPGAPAPPAQRTPTEEAAYNKLQALKQAATTSPSK